MTLKCDEKWFLEPDTTAVLLDLFILERCSIESWPGPSRLYYRHFPISSYLSSGWVKRRREIVPVLAKRRICRRTYNCFLLGGCQLISRRYSSFCRKQRMKVDLIIRPYPCNAKSSRFTEDMLTILQYTAMRKQSQVSASRQQKEGHHNGRGWNSCWLFLSAMAFVFIGMWYHKKLLLSLHISVSCV